MQCYNCEKWGNVAKNCWYNKDRGAIKGYEEGANFAHQDSDDSKDMVVMVVVTDEHVDTKIWFLDTSYSNHITGRKVRLTDFDESKKSVIPQFCLDILKFS